ncbi:MAG: CNNM domain-containing protein, partial [Planctomycetota bacterium]
RPLAAILTLNTVAHTIGAAGVGAQAAAVWGEEWVLLVSAAVTILVLVFSEIVPKTIGAVYAKPLALTSAQITWVLMIGLGPVVTVCDRLSRFIARSESAGAGPSRDEISFIARMAGDGGALAEDEARLIKNLLGLRDTPVDSVMTPRPVVSTIPASTTAGEAVARGEVVFSRLPVVGASLDETHGFVHRHDILNAIAEDRADATMANLARPLGIVPGRASLHSALRTLIESNEHMLLVVDEYGGSLGILTLEDAIETLLGVEIVDETDSHTDMQSLARRLARSRGAQGD